MESRLSSVLRCRLFSDSEQTFQEHLQHNTTASKPIFAYIYAFQDVLLTKRKTKLVFIFVGVGMSGGSSRGKGFGSGRGKGGQRELPLCGKGLLGLISLRNQCISSPPRARVISLKSALSEDTIIGRKIGQNACMVRITQCRCSPRGSTEVVASSNAHQHG